MTENGLPIQYKVGYRKANGQVLWFERPWTLARVVQFRKTKLFRFAVGEFVFKEV
jgi:hypothetical protein